MYAKTTIISLICTSIVFVACASPEPEANDLESTVNTPELVGDWSTGGEAESENERFVRLAEQEQKRLEQKRIAAEERNRELHRHGAIPVAVKSHCAYGYHIVARDAEGKKVFDQWIDKERHSVVYLFPGTKFFFCGQNNECPSKHFYLLEKSRAGHTVNVYTPCP